MPSGYDLQTQKPFGWPLLARKMTSTNRPGLANPASQFTQLTPEVSSILSEARQQTKTFDDAEIVADMMKGRYDPREMKRRPTTTYLIMPPLQMRRQAPYMRVGLNAVLRAAIRPRQPGEPKVVFLLNEMATYGQMDMLSDVWGIVRGYGVQIVSVWQSNSQLREIWGRDNADTFISQAGVQAYFGASDMATAKAVAERCGNTTAVAAGYNNTQQGGNSGTSSGLNWGQVKVPTVTPHQILGLRDGRMVQFANGLADYVSAYAPPYWKIRQCRERARANPYYRPRKGA